MLTDNRSVIKSTKEFFIARVPSNKVLGTFQKTPIFRKVRFLYMKATGIVRRIEECVIKTPRIHIAKGAVKNSPKKL